MKCMLWLLARRVVLPCSIPGTGGATRCSKGQRGRMHTLMQELIRMHQCE